MFANVMAHAHNEARKLVKARPLMKYKLALQLALKVCHKHAKLIVKLAKAGSVSRNTHQLKEGDTIRHYGCIFRLKNKRRSNCHGDSEVYVFDTVCLARQKDSAVPVHWIKREGGFTIQGNERASWAVVTE